MGCRRSVFAAYILGRLDIANAGSQKETGGETWLYVVGIRDCNCTLASGDYFLLGDFRFNDFLPRGRGMGAISTS